MEDKDFDFEDKNNYLWVHCNRCVASFAKKPLRFAILSCKHIFCERCVKKYILPSRICVLCKKLATRCETICNSMQVNYKKLFHPRPWEDLNNIKDVIPFQKEQKKMFIKKYTKIKNYADEKRRRIDDLEKKEKKCLEERKRIYLENCALKEQIKQLEKEKNLHKRKYRMGGDLLSQDSSTAMNEVINPLYGL